MYELVEKLLLLKTGTVRTTDGIKSRVRTVRQNFVDNNQRDPFVLEQWDRQLVDTWLTGRGVQRNRIEDLIKIDDATNDIIDKVGVGVPLGSAW